MLKAKLSRLHPSSGFTKRRMSQRKLHLNKKKKRKRKSYDTNSDNVTKRTHVPGSSVVCVRASGMLKSADGQVFGRQCCDIEEKKCASKLRLKDTYSEFKQHRGSSHAATPPVTQEDST